jgi:hypothetical protein
VKTIQFPHKDWHIQEHNIKMDLKELGYELDSSGSGQIPVVGSGVHGNETFCSIKDGKFLPSTAILAS